MPSDPSNSSTILPGDVDYASIATALDASDVAYDVYSGAAMLTTGGDVSSAYESLIGSGWTQVPEQPGIDVVDDVHYQGVAFYKDVDGVTEVIVANRGSALGDYGYDWTTSDFNIARGAPVAANAAAVNYYQAVTKWIGLNITGPVQIIETGHSLGGEEADYVQAGITGGQIRATYTTETVTFDAPGLPKTPSGLNEPGIDALNISLSTDPVHALGAEFNAGYGGESVTVQGGVSLTLAFLFGGPLGFLYEGFSDHRLGQITGYLVPRR